MAKLEQYRETVQKLLQDYTAFDRGDRTVETELIFDTTRDHYQIVHVAGRAKGEFMAVFCT